jgi:glutathione synthase/RimK-type ligase-like ATP-grasp enzyme
MTAVGIHVQPRKQFCAFLRRYELVLAHNGLDCVRLDSDAPDFLAQVKDLDLFIYRWGNTDVERNHALALIPALEWGLGIKCFPNVATCWHYDDKVRQHYLLTARGYPFVQGHAFWEPDAARAWAATATLPLVFKLSAGAGSDSVMLVRTRRLLTELIERAFGAGFRPGGVTAGGREARGLPDRLRRRAYAALARLRRQNLPFRFVVPDWQAHRNYVYFQEFLADNSFDTRITVIGDRAFGFRRFNRPGDFRASGSGLIDHNPQEVDLRSVELAHRVSQDMGFQSMAYDMLFDARGNVRICEISYTYQDRAVFLCPGYWDRKLRWHEGHFWPQLSHLQSLLERPELGQPDDLQSVEDELP